MRVYNCVFGMGVLHGNGFWVTKGLFLLGFGWLVLHCLARGLGGVWYQTFVER
jgi:hypothetical protein